MAPSQPSPGLLSSSRMEIWPDSIQPKVTPAPLLLQDITYLWPASISSETDCIYFSVLWTWFALCNLSPTKSFLQEKEGIYCVFWKAKVSGHPDSAAKHKCPCSEDTINQKSQNIQPTLRLFSKLIRPPCWKETEGIRKEPDLYLERNAQKFTQVLVNYTAFCFPFLRAAEGEDTEKLNSVGKAGRVFRVPKNFPKLPQHSPEGPCPAWWDRSGRCRGKGPCLASLPASEQSSAPLINWKMRIIRIPEHPCVRKWNESNLLNQALVL